MQVANQVELNVDRIIMPLHHVLQCQGMKLRLLTIELGQYLLMLFLKEALPCARNLRHWAHGILFQQVKGWRLGPDKGFNRI
jgi:hypothetical protein